MTGLAAVVAGLVIAVALVSLGFRVLRALVRSLGLLGFLFLAMAVFRAFSTMGGIAK